ncbi:hypothetical protein A0H81_14265 [Grifola frondosa]|uniref:Uncharacterized protein n=1 Tax=Grifola frondosa TaxID=5627 RepID=A0A1C7LP39_GRIFR|nr:hypothetical protein A0H81_14265 [Grifola frondosa]
MGPDATLGGVGVLRNVFRSFNISSDQTIQIPSSGRAKLGKTRTGATCGLLWVLIACMRTRDCRMLHAPITAHYQAEMTLFNDPSFEDRHMGTDI